MWAWLDRRTILRLTFVALAPLALSACEPSRPASDATPALWIVENASGEVEGWLFGTIHSLPDGVDWRTTPLERAIGSADAVVLEIGELGDDGRSAAIFAQLAATDNLPPLNARIDPALKDNLAALLRQGGYTDEDFATTESWAAALTLAQVGASGSAANGVDRALQREFDDVRILEGARGQLSIFDTLPFTEQRDLLEAVIADAEDDREAEYRELVRIWRDGDMAALVERNGQGFLADPELRETLLTRRNRRWAAAIDRWMQDDGPLLVAVGASHVAGAGGLPELMNARGYTVRRVQ